MQNDRAGEWSATLGSRPAAGGIMFLREVLKQGFEVQIICLEGLGGWELDRQLLGSCSKERRSPGMTSYLGSESERNPPLPFSPSLHPPPPACAAQEPSLFPGQQRFPAVAAWRDLAAGRRRELSVPPSSSISPPFLHLQPQPALGLPPSFSSEAVESARSSKQPAASAPLPVPAWN